MTRQWLVTGWCYCYSLERFTWPFRVLHHVDVALNPSEIPVIQAKFAECRIRAAGPTSPERFPSWAGDLNLIFRKLLGMAQGVTHHRRESVVIGICEPAAEDDSFRTKRAGNSGRCDGDGVLGSFDDLGCLGMSVGRRLKDLRARLNSQHLAGLADSRSQRSTYRAGLYGIVLELNRCFELSQ